MGSSLPSWQKHEVMEPNAAAFRTGRSETPGETHTSPRPDLPLTRLLCGGCKPLRQAEPGSAVYNTVTSQNTLWHPRARGVDPALQFSTVPWAQLLKPQLQEGQSPPLDSFLNIKGAQETGRAQTKEGGCLQPEHWSFFSPPLSLFTQSMLAMINETTLPPATASSQKVCDHKMELSKSALRSKTKHPEIPVKNSFLSPSRIQYLEICTVKDCPQQGSKSILRLIICTLTTLQTYRDNQLNYFPIWGFILLMKALPEEWHVYFNDSVPLIYTAQSLRHRVDLQISKWTLLVCICNSYIQAKALTSLICWSADL